MQAALLHLSPLFHLSFLFQQTLGLQNGKVLARLGDLFEYPLPQALPERVDSFALLLLQLAHLPAPVLQLLDVGLVSRVVQESEPLLVLLLGLLLPLQSLLIRPSLLGLGLLWLVSGEVPGEGLPLLPLQSVVYNRDCRVQSEVRVVSSIFSQTRESRGKRESVCVSAPRSYLSIGGNEFAIVSTFFGFVSC